MFAALAVSHWIERQTGWSIKKSVQTLRRYRTVTIRAGNHTLTAADPLPAEIQDILATITSAAETPSSSGDSDTATEGAHYIVLSRDTGGARAAIQEARAALKLSWRYIEAFEAQAAALYAQPMDTDEMRRFAARLVDVEGADSPADARSRGERACAIVKLWTSSPTIAAIAGTRWAAYNAVTEYVDHYSSVRSGRDEHTARALRAVTIGSSAQALKSNAFRMLQTL